MTRKRKNAGKGYGMMFHGAFSEKADAKRKEREVHGFIQPRNIKGERRYVVMSERKNPIKRRKKEVKPNPHELLVMGANPGETHHHHEHHQEITVPAGSTITIRMNPSGEAENPLFSFHPSMVPRHLREGSLGKRKRVSWDRLKPAKRRAVAIAAGVSESIADTWSRIKWRDIPEGWHDALISHLGTLSARQNPSAEAIREDFTGMPVENERVRHEPHMPAGDYALLGKLLILYVKPWKGGQVLEIRAKGVTIVSDESARQIWFVGGDQDVTDALGEFGAVDRGDGIYGLGEARRIDYEQRKEHVKDPDQDRWRHEFGEETGQRPLALFDANHKRLLLEGGAYEIRREGIVN